MIYSTAARKSKSPLGNIPKWIWRFPEMGVPQTRWFIKKNPIKMDDLGIPLFQETSIYVKNTSSVLWDQHPWDEKPLEKELQLPTSQRTLWQNDRNNFCGRL